MRCSDVLSAVSMHVYDYNMPTTWIELVGEQIYACLVGTEGGSSGEKII